MAKKKYDAVVRVGEYTDRNGETKAKWLNVGVVLATDNGHCLLLDRTFNPAGIADPDGRGTVLISLFEPQERQQQGNGYAQASRGGQPQRQQPAGDPGFDDSEDLPF